MQRGRDRGAVKLPQSPAMPNIGSQLRRSDWESCPPIGGMDADPS